MERKRDLSLRIVVIEVPVIALIFRRDIPFRSRDMSLAYCCLMVSSLFR